MIIRSINLDFVEFSVSLLFIVKIVVKVMIVGVDCGFCLPVLLLMLLK
jgi:hypothetical protein